MENIEQRIEGIEKRLAIQEQMHDHVSYTKGGGLHGKRNVVYQAIGTWVLAGIIIGAAIVLTVKITSKPK